MHRNIEKLVKKPYCQVDTYPDRLRVWGLKTQSTSIAFVVSLSCVPFRLIGQCCLHVNFHTRKFPGLFSTTAQVHAIS